MNVQLHQTMFDNFDHFKQVVMTYGKHAFSEIEINEKMLSFIVQNFIESRFLSNDGRILGMISEYEREYKYLNMDAKAKRKKQRETLDAFFVLFIDNFSDDTISIPSSHDEPFASGTYGALFPYIAQGKLTKYVSSIDEKNGGRDYNIIISLHEALYYSFMIEFCTFVIVMAIFIFVDCNLTIDDNSGVCSKKQYRTKTDSYCSFFAVIDRPFIKLKTYVKGNIPVYVMGYVMDEYDFTLQKKLATVTNEDLPICLNLFEQTIHIIQKLFDLSKIGITISHRDITSVNVMCSKNEDGVYQIRLIDFGFLCANIKFKDGNTSVIGDHPYGNDYDLAACDKKYIDIILFLVTCIRDHPKFLNLIETETLTHIKAKYILKAIVAFNRQKLFDSVTAVDQNAQQYVIDDWTYAASIGEAVSITDNDVVDIFNKVHKLLNDIYSNLPPTMKVIRPYYEDVKSIKPVDVSDKFTKLYQENKNAYLHLSQLV